MRCKMVAVMRPRGYQKNNWHIEGYEDISWGNIGITANISKLNPGPNHDLTVSYNTISHPPHDILPNDNYLSWFR